MDSITVYSSGDLSSGMLQGDPEGILEQPQGLFVWPDMLAIGLDDAEH